MRKSGPSKRELRDAKIADLYANKVRKTEIAERVGLSYAGVLDALRRLGLFLKGDSPDTTPPLVRFERKFRVTPGCWPWIGSFNQTGYGAFSIGYKNILPHRFSYESYCGPIPPGMMILHSCDNRACVNPDHLRVGTHDDNMRDMAERKRVPFHGGELSPTAKLSEVQVRAIFADPRAGVVIAKEYGVNPSTVSLIKSRTNWAHLSY